MHSAERRAAATALVHAGRWMSYEALAGEVARCACGLAALGVRRDERVAVWLGKCPEAVVAYFATAAAGGVFVPVNPVLKAGQVAHVLRDSGAHVLVTSPERQAMLVAELSTCPALRHVALVGEGAEPPAPRQVAVHRWAALRDAPPADSRRIIDADMAAILYTSGSTGLPKGVVLSHRNMVIGALSVTEYLQNDADDILLAALPLSFDAGFSQLTTAFCSGARVVLLNYLLPRDVLDSVIAQRVTGLTAVPPLWIQLAQLRWPDSVGAHLRYIANTGGRMPAATLKRLRTMLPKTKTYLMYGLTEAFRATYLPPELVDERPDSIGKAIPNAEVLVLREDGTPCAPNEPGELVQRGALVSLGYWNDALRTAERFKPLPVQSGSRAAALGLPEIAVFSGDLVRMDEEGWLYFLGRRDEMMKTSGYRVSPTEVEEIVYGTELVGECAAFGVPHEVLGEVIAVAVTAPAGRELDVAQLRAACQAKMPAYMVPAHIEVHEGALPRNQNGKLDRAALRRAWMKARESGAYDRA